MELRDIKNKIASFSSIGKNNRPHSIAVEINEVSDKRIIITDNYMKNTIENIKNNPFISLVIIEGTDAIYIDGKAEYYTSGKWIDLIKSMKENKGYPAKGAIIIEILKITKV